jgi:hypothetical protein
MFESGAGAAAGRLARPLAEVLVNPAEPPALPGLRRLDPDHPDPVPAGPGMAALLADADPAGLPDHQLIDVITAFDRLASWVAAGQAAAIDT